MNLITNEDFIVMKKTVNRYIKKLTDWELVNKDITYRNDKDGWGSIPRNKK